MECESFTNHFGHLSSIDIIHKITTKNLEIMKTENQQKPEQILCENKTTVPMSNLFVGWLQHNRGRPRKDAKEEPIENNSINKNQIPMNTQNQLRKKSRLLNQSSGLMRFDVDTDKFVQTWGGTYHSMTEAASGNARMYTNLFSMKRKMLMYKFMLMIFILAPSGLTKGQSSQTPTQTICIGSEPYLVTNTPGSIYDWLITPGNSDTDWSIIGTGNSISVNWIRPGVYNLSAMETNAQNCIGLPVSVTVTVNPIPDVTDPSDQVICNGSPVTAVNFTGTVIGTIFNWVNDTPSIGLVASGSGNIASFNAVNTGTAPVVATITVTPSANGCTGTPITFTITVNPLTIPTIIPAIDPVCFGNTGTYTTESGKTNYIWSVDGGIINVGQGTESITVTWNGTGPYNVSVTYTNGTGCSAATPTIQSVNVTPLPATSPIYHN
jgi:hypothetical protein